MSLEVGTRISLRIERLVAGGDGLARHAGQVVFVPATAPGDEVSVVVTQAHPRFARARVTGFEREGQRRTPRCGFYVQCGGCRWMHLPEAVQSATRVELLRDALIRIARYRDLPTIEHQASPQSFEYRARARVAYAEGQVGFRGRGSHDLVPIDRCVVLDPATQAELDQVQARVPSGVGELELRGFGRRVDGLHVSPGAFVQANRSLWKPWIEWVLQCCGRGGVLLELFAGVGFYTVALAPRFERVIAVERARSARDLRRNTRAEVFESSVEQFLADYRWDPRPDVVLLNPPRTGCARGVMQRIRGGEPSRIVYVSCEPATLARDLLALGTAYRPTRIIALDALPQTHHVEAIVVLESN